MKKDTIFRLTLAVAVAAAVFVIGYFARPDLFGREEAFVFGSVSAHRGAEGIPTIGGQIVYIEGTVKFRNPTGLWQDASEGVDLEEGYAVETLSGSRAIIAMDDGSMLRLDDETQISLESTDPHAMAVGLSGGRVYSRVVEADRTFEIMAGDIVYESLGTAYTTELEEDEAGVKVFHSKVRVKDADGNELAVVDEGEKYLVKSESNPAAEGKVVDMGEDEIKEDAFVKWNAGEDSRYFDSEMGLMAIADGTAVASDVDLLSGIVESIVLSYGRNGKVTWSVTGVAPLGFKLVWSKTDSPVYPTREGDKYKYYDKPEARSGTIYAFDGAGTYHIRVCEYMGDVCGVYSNEVTATFMDDPGAEKEKEDSITTSSVTSVALSGSGSSVSWTVEGYSPSGYKLVWSRESGPTYPTRAGDKYEYYADPGARSGTAYAFDGAGTYYARVCEYLGGECGTYSNEVTLQLETEETGYGSAKAVPQGDVTSVSLSVAGPAAVSWVADGYSPMGFKVVWSKESGPTYPLRPGDKYVYMAEPDDSYLDLFAFRGPGTYYVRVCEYQGGECGVYSNEIQMEL